MELIMAIHPKWVRMIENGIKTFELRKHFPENISKVWVYETNPEKNIVGYFEVGEIIKMPPEKLIEMIQYFGTTEKEFKEYFKAKKIGIAIEILNFKKIERIKFNWQSVYPQSYKIINSIADI